jgi:hypothetical protein
VEGPSLRCVKIGTAFMAAGLVLFVGSIAG